MWYFSQTSPVSNSSSSSSTTTRMSLNLYDPKSRHPSLAFGQVTNRTCIAYRKFNDGARVQIHRLRSRSFSFGRPFLGRSDPPQKIPIGKVPLPARIFCCNVIFFFDATKERIINPPGLYSSEFMAAIRAAFSGPKDELKRGRTERDTLIRE